MRKIIVLLVLAFISCEEGVTEKKARTTRPDYEDTSVAADDSDTSEDIEVTNDSEAINNLRYVNTSSNLNYRDAPNGKVIGQFKSNDQVTIVDRSGVFTEIVDEGEQIRGEWVGVSNNGDTVYVFDAFLSETPSLTDVWSKFPMRKIPFEDTTNFDNIDTSHRLSKSEIDQLQLEELYPDIHKYEYKVYPSYQLDYGQNNVYGDYKSIVVNVFKGDHELFSHLIIYDADDTLHKIYQGEDEKPTVNAVVVAYDEIAEGWSRTSSQFKYNCITTVHALYTEPPQIDTLLYHINNQGLINKVDIDFKNDIRPNEEIKIGKIYTDTIQFIKYNDDYDYFFIEAKKNNKDVSLIYNWEFDNKKYDFKKNDYIQVQWEMDSTWVAGDGETLYFSEYARDAKKVEK